LTSLFCTFLFELRMTLLHLEHLSVLYNSYDTGPLNVNSVKVHIMCMPPVREGLGNNGWLAGWLAFRQISFLQPSLRYQEINRTVEGNKNKRKQQDWLFNLRIE
jgi:hypothetical protein